MIIFITLLAWITHVVSKILKAQNKFKSKFDLKKWLKLNSIYFLFSLLCVILALSFVQFKELKDIEMHGVVISLKYVIAFCIGWMAPSIIAKIVKIGNKKLKEDV